MVNISKKYSLRKLAIGLVSLAVGLSATNGSLIHAKEIETIAKLIYINGKVAAGENDSVRASLVFKEGKAYAEVYAHKNIKNVVIEVVAEDNKVYKIKLDSMSFGETKSLLLEEKEKEKDVSKIATEEEKDREVLKFEGILNEVKYRVKVSYEVESKDSSVVTKKDSDTIKQAPVQQIYYPQQVVREIIDYNEVQVEEPQEIVVTEIVTEAPITKIVTEAPVVRVIEEVPVSRLVEEAPVTRVISEEDSIQIVEEAPEVKIVTEAPVTRIVVEEPVTKIVTEEGTTRIVAKTEPLVESEKPSIPIVTSKVTESTLLAEEKPEVPIQSAKNLAGEIAPQPEVKKEVKVQESFEVVEFTEERQDDRSLLIGTTVVETEGKQGLRRIVEFDGKVEINEIVEKPINKLIKIGVLKEKPVLAYRSLMQDDLNKEVDISYNLTDKHAALIRTRLYIYDGDELVKEVDVDDINSVLSQLDHYDTPYRIVTKMTYDVNDGKGPQEEVLEDKNIGLTLKKIEIKDVDSVSLNKFENNELKVVPSLGSTVLDVAKHFVRVKSDRFRDKLLPVKSVEEVVENGVKYFKVNAMIPELVQDGNPGQISDYKEGYSFLLPQLTVTQEKGVFTTFRNLISAIKENPSGNFKIGADLYAEELTPGPLSYIDNFTGTLTGENKGTAYTIFGLKAPLFNKLSGKVSDLDLEDVDISATDEIIGSLAREAVNSTVSNVATSGSLRGSRTIGGLIGKTTDTNIENVYFKGNIYSMSNAIEGESYVGGITGYMNKGALTKAYVDAQINSFASNNAQRSGGIVGNLFGGNASSISKVYSKGSIVNRSTNPNGASGITGSIYPSANLIDAVSEMDVQGGVSIYGDTAHVTAKVDLNTVAAVEGAKATTTNKWDTRISPAEALDRLASYGITANVEDSKGVRVDTRYSIDYTSLRNASPDRATAYLNIEKLIPFYNKEQIIKYGNLVDATSKLFSSKLLSVTPMKDDKILSNLSDDKLSLNKLMLHYEDGTLSYINLKYKEDFKNTSISEYDIEGTKLIYTPEQFVTNNYDDILSATITDLKSVKLNSDEVAKALGIVISQADIDKLVEGGMTPEKARKQLLSNKIDQLYLSDAFEVVKENIEENLRSALSTDKSINTTSGVVNDYLIDYIKDNKEKILLGLAYIQRWYNINFDDFNFRELATFHQDFFGKPVNTLEWLVSIAKSYDVIKASNNVLTYGSHISQNTGIIGQMDYLSRLRHLFLPDKTDAQWFKGNTKAYIVEQKSEENPSIDVSLWQRIKESVGIPIDDLNGVLPLLTAKEGIFVITNMASITYGMYEKYLDMALKDSDPAEYEKQLTDLKSQINIAAKRFAENVDVWYRIVDDKVKANMLKVVPIWDGYKRFDNKWLPLYGVDSKTGARPNQAILDFFGPVGERAVIANNGTGAYANGWLIKYVNYKILNDIGIQVYSHEMTHNLDSIAYLGNYGRRDGMGGESYATGMFETPLYNSDVLSYNLIFDNSEKVDALDRLHAVDPKRFKDASDLQEYAKGTLDVLYTLDYAEANSVLSKGEAEHKKWFIKFENGTNSKGELIGKYRTITDAEWASMQLKDINDLIDNSIMTKRSYPTPNNRELIRNGYDTIHMFSPIYSALSNDNGVPSNSLIFKLRSYELMAAKGYEDGFIPYASNKLNAEAKAAGLATQTEKFVLDKIFAGKYNSWAEFKKDTYKERINNISKLKEVTITYEGAEILVNDFAKIQELMNKAVDYDIANNTMANASKSKVKELKVAIYNAYLRSTNDFTTSIYR